VVILPYIGKDIAGQDTFHWACQMPEI